MFCGDFHTNIYQLFNTKFNPLIYLSTYVHLARNLKFSRRRVTVERNLDPKNGWMSASKTA